MPDPRLRRILSRWLVATSLVAQLPLTARAAPQAEFDGSPAFGAGDYGKFGTSVLRVGDLDRDGTDDFVIGAPDADGLVGADCGAVHGRSGVLPTTELGVLYGTQAGERTGSALARVGDVDGDGVDDIAVGAPEFDGMGGTRQGRLFVLSGATFRELLTFTVDEPGIQFGHALAAAGDRDGDGIQELIVGAPYADQLANDAGAAFLLHVDSTSVSLLWRFDGDEAGEKLGLAVTTLPDVDGDGVDDLCVGSPEWDGGAGINFGRVQLFSGDDLQGCPRLNEFTGGASNDEFGFALAPIGNPNGGAGACLLVSFIGRRSIVFTYVGGAAIVEPLTGMVLREVLGDDRNQFLGFSVATVGDIDGDLIEDFALGAPTYTPYGAFFGGCVDVFSAKGSGSTSAPRAFRLVGASGQRFGQALAPCGDVDGDRCPDLLMGASGEVDPVTGLETGALHVLRMQRPRLRTDKSHYVDLESMTLTATGWSYSPTFVLFGTKLSGMNHWGIDFTAPWYILPALQSDQYGQVVVTGHLPDLLGAPLNLYFQAYVVTPAAKKGSLLFSEIATISMN